MTELKDIYVPAGENVVIQFEIPDPKTKKARIELMGKAAKEYQDEHRSPVMQIIQIGPDVKNFKIGDWILPYAYFKPHQVPLLYKNTQLGIQHAQIHVSEIMGKVDSHFAVLQTETKELTVN